MLVNKKVIAVLVESLILLICFAYPIQAMCSVVFKINSTPVNIGFRIIYLLISTFLVFHSYKKWPISMLIFVLFWVLYGFRLISDVSFIGKRYLDNDSFFVYSFAFGSCFIPSIAVFLNTQFIQITRLSKNIFLVVLFSNLCIISNIFLFSTEGILGAFLSRANANVEVDGNTIAVINSITIGFFGELLILLSVIQLVFREYFEKKRPLYLYVFSLILGLLNIVLGASRGPLLSLAVLLVYIGYSFLSYKQSIQALLKIVVVALGIGISFFLLWFFFLDDLDVELFNRFNFFIESQQVGEKEIRQYEWESAFIQFLRSPLLGDSFVTDFDQSYAHNLFLDCLMSTGLLGFMMLVLLLYRTHKVYCLGSRDYRVNLYPIWVTYLSFLLLSMTSGGLFMCYTLWIMIAFISSEPAYENY